MEIWEAIQRRYSVRKFQERMVDRKILLALAEAAQKAPSASNLQARRFLFITDCALRGKVELFSPGISGKPPVILVICSDMDKASQKGGKNAEKYGCMMDAAMAAENIMLLALEYGLGCCAIKSYNDVAIRKILQIPSGYRIELLVSIGYPEGNGHSPQRPHVNTVTFFDRWEEKGND